MSSIEYFVYSLVTHPVFSLGFILAFAAGFSFLIFLRGFLSGAGHMFTIDHHDHHLFEARTRAVWGVVLLLDIFLIWVTIRSVAALFGGTPVDVSLTITIYVLYIMWRALAAWLLPDPPKGH